MPVYTGDHGWCVCAVDTRATLVADGGFLVLVALVAGGHVECGVHVVLLVIVLSINPLGIIRNVLLRGA